MDSLNIEREGLRSEGSSSGGRKSGTTEHELKGTDGVLGSRRICRSRGHGPGQGGLRADGDSSSAADREDNADGAGISGDKDEVDGPGVVDGQDGEDELGGTGDGGLKSGGLGRWSSGGRGSKMEAS